MKIQILNRITDAVIFEAEIEGRTKAIRLGLAVCAALKAKTNLQSANLQDANLRGADLRGADLRDANLQCADLRYADLRDANLQCADLRYADLRDANLRGADLRDAHLRDTNLQDANLDFSSVITFRCSSFGFRCDFRLIAQIMCHVARLESDDPKALEIITEVRRRWGNDFCRFREDVEPGHWDAQVEPTA